MAVTLQHRRLPRSWPHEAAQLAREGRPPLRERRARRTRPHRRSRPCCAPCHLPLLLGARDEALCTPREFTQRGLRRRAGEECSHQTGAERRADECRVPTADTRAEAGWQGAHRAAVPLYTRARPERALLISGGRRWHTRGPQQRGGVPWRCRAATPRVGATCTWCFSVLSIIFFFFQSAREPRRACRESHGRVHHVSARRGAARRAGARGRARAAPRRAAGCPGGHAARVRCVLASQAPPGREGAPPAARRLASGSWGGHVEGGKAGTGAARRGGCRGAPPRGAGCGALVCWPLPSPRGPAAPNEAPARHRGGISTYTSPRSRGGPSCAVRRVARAEGLGAAQASRVSSVRHEPLSRCRAACRGSCPRAAVSSRMCIMWGAWTPLARRGLGRSCEDEGRGSPSALEGHVACPARRALCRAAAAAPPWVPQVPQGGGGGG